MPEEFELPAVFERVDAASLDAQARFLRSTRLQLVLLVLASGLGTFSWKIGGVEAPALAAGATFLAAAGLRVALLRSKPHRRWYEGRAAAESFKTLSWRYSTGGHPFGLDKGEKAVSSFVEQAKAVFGSLSSFDVSANQVSECDPSTSMQRLRAASLDERRSAYVRGRVDDQLQWYSRKSNWNRVRARFWGSAVLCLLLAGAIGAFLRGFDVIDFDLFGVAAALAASGAAWLATKQHGDLANAYRIAADELSRIRQLADGPRDESGWARFVSESEGAISREHTMWKATSSRLGPADLA